MTSPSELMKQYRDEAYQYFDQNIRPIPKDEYGEFIINNETAHNNDIDAFRHAYVMGKLTMSGFQSSVVKYVGIDHEADVANNPEERDMDLYNNSIGIRLGGFSRNEQDLVSNLKSALENGDLITSPRLISEEERKEVSSIIKESLADALSFGNPSISAFVQLSFNSLFTAQSTTSAPFIPRRVDPLTLDLDGDGVELINVNNSKAFFDLDLTQVSSLEQANDIKSNPNNPNYNPNATIYSVTNSDGSTSYYLGDGVKEQVGWISSDDGLLTLDKNNNDTIDNILELFGKTDKTGTEELREYDLNQDGVINSSDAVFSNLKIWQDYNQNGISEKRDEANIIP